MCRLGRFLVSTALGATALSVAACGSQAAPRDARLQEVDSFAFALGSGNLDGDLTGRFAPFDLVVVDGEEAHASQVRALRARGKLVLAYLSVGTIEPGRFWYTRAKPYRLADRFEEFDEPYAATSKPGYRRLIAGRVAPRILRKGFDGLFLDNTDMIADHPRQERGMRRLVKALADLVHRRGGLLFSQNGDDVIGPSLPYYDGWNREDVTWTYDFDGRRYVRVPASDTDAAQATMRRFARRGLLVTSSDYTRAGDRMAEAEAVRNSCAVDGLPFVTDIRVTRIPAQPFRCP